MSKSFFVFKKNFAKVISIGALATLNLASGIEIPGLSSLGTDAAQAAPVDCNSQWAQDALGYLVDRLGHVPPFFFCYEIERQATETTQIDFTEADIRMGLKHAFVAECDVDCSDIDLRIYDQYGSLLASDTSTDSYAEVVIDNISVGSSFTVEMETYSCRTSYCGAVLGTLPRR